MSAARMVSMSTPQVIDTWYILYCMYLPIIVIISCWCDTCKYYGMMFQDWSGPIEMKALSLLYKWVCLMFIHNVVTVLCRKLFCRNIIDTDRWIQMINHDSLRRTIKKLLKDLFSKYSVEHFLIELMNFSQKWNLLTINSFAVIKFAIKFESRILTTARVEEQRMHWPPSYINGYKFQWLWQTFECQFNFFLYLCI